MRQQIILLTISVVLNTACTHIPEGSMFYARTVPIQPNLKTTLGVQTERGLKFTLESVFFEVNSATLSAMSGAQLDDFAQIINQYDNKMVSIEGHTDNTGDSIYNLMLSERRAQAVRDALMMRGVNPSRFIVQGFGESHPLASNATRIGRQKNRRVEIIILD